MHVTHPACTHTALCAASQPFGYRVQSRPPIQTTRRWLRWKKISCGVPAQGKAHQRDGHPSAAATPPTQPYESMQAARAPHGTKCAGPSAVACSSAHAGHHCPTYLKEAKSCVAARTASAGVHDSQLGGLVGCKPNAVAGQLQPLPPSSTAPRHPERKHT